MHAIRLHEFGPADNLRWEQAPDPLPRAGEVRIAVRAAGVHLLDTSLRAGLSGPPLPAPRLPHVPGREVAGVVESVGADVDEAWVGRRVVVHLGREPEHGGYAELTVAPAAALHELPDGLSDAAAVAMIGTGRTTLAILEVARLTSADVVLVTAAAGGIGSLLVQAAGNADALVAGAAGGDRKVAHVRELGAEIAVDYNRPTWQAELRDALGGYELTVAFDSVGGTLGRQALDLLAPGGHFVTYGGAAGPTEFTSDDVYNGGLTVSSTVGPRILQRPGGLRGLETDALAAAESGALTPALQTFPLAEAAAAHAALEGRATTGKVVLLT